MWALFAALLLEFGINTFNRQTLWHRVTILEERLDHLERLRSR